MIPLLSIPALAELAKRAAWVCWRHCADRRTGKPTKVPFTPAGSKASTTDPTSWSSYAECFAAAFVEGRHHGIGRVLTGDDGLVGIDLDDAVASDGAVAPWANQIVQTIATYWEVSPSGAGLHGWARGSWPTDGNKGANIEVYAKRRFFTVTGAHLRTTSDVIRPCAPALSALWHARFTNKKRPAPPVSADPFALNLPEPMPADLVRSLARTHPQLRRILEGSYASLSERDLALVRFAKIAGWQREAAWALVAAVRTDGKAERADYAERTIARVYE